MQCSSCLLNVGSTILYVKHFLILVVYIWQVAPRIQWPMFLQNNFRLAFFSFFNKRYIEFGGCFIALLMAAFGIWYLQLISLTISNLKTDFNLFSYFHQGSKSSWSDYSTGRLKLNAALVCQWSPPLSTYILDFVSLGSSPLLTLHLPTKT